MSKVIHSSVQCRLGVSGEVSSCVQVGTVELANNVTCSGWSKASKVSSSYCSLSLIGLTNALGSSVTAGGGKLVYHPNSSWLLKE